MKLTNAQDVIELLNGFISSAAFATALELGLFHELAAQPLTHTEIAQRWKIPARRCQHWLNLLAQLGLLEKRGETFAVSALTRTAILDTYTAETWKFMARRLHAWYPIGENLVEYIQYPGSLWSLHGQAEPSDYRMVKQDAAWADRYTRMLYERAQFQGAPLAEQLDMTGVRRMMDLGGGSGAVSFALLKRYPELTSVVVEVKNVCPTGRALAAEQGLADRVTFYSADILTDELPTGFQLVIESDVGLYDTALFRRVYAALEQGGRFVLNQPWAERDGTVPDRLILSNFRSSLEEPTALECTRDEARAMMLEAGFCDLSEWACGEEDIVLEGRKP